MNKLTNVECFHSGGGCISYYAKFNDEVWLAGDLWGYFGSYDMPKELVDEDYENGIPYESHAKSPSIPYPTWNDILDSLYGTEIYHWAVLHVKHYHENLDEMCMEDDRWKMSDQK